MKQIVMEDDLLKEYYNFKNGNSDNPQLIEKILIYFKPYLTNLAQFKRIGIEPDTALKAKLANNDLISQNLNELSNLTSLKFILSNDKSDYPYININEDIIKTDFTGTLKKESTQKIIRAIQALCKSADTIYIYDKYLKDHLNVAVQVSDLFPRKQMSIIYHDNQLSGEIISSWKRKCREWKIKKDRTNKYSRFHDRYLIIDNTIEIILTGGFDKLFDDDYDSTYIFRLLK